MKKYDCFLYFNEDSVLELRLNELDSIVDIFVIVEGTITHSGFQKSINFDVNKPQFQKFKNKIRHIIADKLPLTPDSSVQDWRTAEAQMDCIAQGLYDVEDEDIIMLSDLDEIPRATDVKNVIDNIDDRNYRFHLSGHSFYFNSSPTKDFWPFGTLLTKYKNFKTLPPNKWKARTGQPEVDVIDSGWHFTYIGGAEAMIKKINALSHRENDNEAGRAFYISEGNNRETVEVLNGHYPKYLRENPIRFINGMKGFKC